MAHYRCRVETPLSVTDAFAYMADVRNFERWDPGVISVTQVAGDGPGPDASYELLTSNGGRENMFRYVVTAFDDPVGYTIVGRKAPFTSTDVISVEAGGDGAIVTYAADLTMPFPLSLADPWLQKTFDRIGDAAAHGLAGALGGRLL